MRFMADTVLPEMVATIKLGPVFILEFNDQSEALSDPHGYTIHAVLAWALFNLFLHKPALASGHRPS